MGSLHQINRDDMAASVLVSHDACVFVEADIRIANRGSLAVDVCRCVLCVACVFALMQSPNARHEGHGASFRRARSGK